MRFRNIDNWKDPESLKGLLYFAQRIEELTFTYTIDSYRAPTMNPPSLVAECLDELSILKSLNKSTASIEHMLDELESRLRNNVIVREMLQLRLNYHLRYDRSSLEDIEKKLRLLEKEISQREYIFKCFELSQKFCLQNELKNIEFVAKEVVTSLRNFGVSMEHINHSVVSKFFKGNKVDSCEILNDFFVEIFPHHHNFTVCFIIDTPAVVMSKEVFGIYDLKLLKKKPQIFKSNGSGNNIRNLKGTENYLLAEKVFAPDKYSAIQEAKGYIQKVHDLFAIFHHKDTYRIDDIAHTIQACCDNEIGKVKVNVNAMQNTIDNKPEDAAKKLEKFIRVLQLARGEEADKFFRVIGFHGLGGQTSSTETQIVNVWTALETMLPSRPNKTIVDSVVSGSLPVIGLNYINRLFRTLSFDFFRWDRRALSNCLQNISAPDDANLVEKVFCLVILKENEPSLAKLFSDLKNFELLRNRAYNLHEIFKTPNSCLNFIEQHQKRVAWQIHRIYRARNEIVHSGANPPNAVNLLSNAHDYFDQVFEIIGSLCSGESGYDNYVDAFNFAEVLYEQYISDIKALDIFEVRTAGRVIWTPPNYRAKNIWTNLNNKVK
ncbi:hypothetical protein ROS1_50180 [Roseibium sp. ROS1]